MRVKCTQIIDPQSDETIAAHPAIHVGGVYPVLEMMTGPDYWMIRVLDDSGNDPGSFWDPAMFETVDAHLPSSWTLVLENGRMRLAHALWQRPNFWNDYFDNDPRALADFRAAKHELLDGTDR
ncbi:hypothetical protein ACFVUY_18475 [Kitasatospora sp. NPDC058063]|uniref:hypothetical protein n=1 Tax=unclassified Kitasatospora TaxID=2633591 RepID=UPI003648877B